MLSEDVSDQRKRKTNSRGSAGPERPAAPPMKKKTDSKTNADKTFEDILLDFQTRLQGVANGLAAKLGELIASTDAAILRTLVKELPKREKSIRSETRRIERLIAKIEKMRRPGFDAARDLTFETALEVGDAASSQTVREIETAQQDAAERGGGDFSASKKSGKRPKSLSAKQVKEIVEYEPIDGESIAGWFEGLRRGDLQRITRAVARASVEGLTVSAIAAAIRGTKANGYRDGILQTTRDGAAKLARTTINGVCNNARLETIRENEDVVDGAKFVGTLDGRTCPHCGALDGKIWPVKELDAVRRPPIHISCRCCVVPHVDLRTPDGKIVEVGTRPAANADFDALAKESYNKTAREKGLKRRWDDLSPSTRLKYYYQAQKDYERRTGKPAYRQVAPSTTFRDYFERQPAAFQRAWLGKNRYELYRTGAATFDDLTKPASTYSATLKDLKLAGKIKNVPENGDNTNKTPAPVALPDLPPLELPDVTGRKARDVSVALAIRRRAVAELTEENAVAAARKTLDTLRAEIKDDAFGERDNLESKIKEIGENAATQILAREILLEGRELAESWNSAADWLDGDSQAPPPLAQIGAGRILQRGVFGVLDALKNWGRDDVSPAVYIPSTDAIKKRFREIDDAYLTRLAKLRQRYSDKIFEEKRKLVESWRKQQYLDVCFPVNKRRSENRVSLRKKTPSTKLGARKGTYRLEKDGAQSVEAALDFTGRIADNLGVDASAFDGLCFHEELVKRAFYLPNGITKAHPRWSDFSREYGVKKDVPPRAVVLQVEAESDGYGVTAAHELGHAFDDCVSSLKSDVIDYYVKITTDPATKKRTALLELPWSTAKKPEHYRKLGVPNDNEGVPYTIRKDVKGQYAARSYRRDLSDSEEREYSTELTSMFFESIFQDVVTYANENPRHFYEMLELYRNNARNRGISDASQTR